MWWYHKGERGQFPSRLGVRSTGSELGLHGEGWVKFVEQGLRMEVFWAEGAAAVRAQRPESLGYVTWRAGGA